jgi:very-short-patch-repair endonuclease
MLAIELDGDTHAYQPEYDATRDRYLESEGFQVLRFTNSEVMTNIEGVLYTIGEALKSPSFRLRGEGRRPRRKPGESQGEGPIQTPQTP